MAWADEVTGPWTVHPPGSLQLADSHFPTQPPAATDAEIAMLRDRCRKHLGSDASIDEAAGGGPAGGTGVSPTAAGVGDGCGAVVGVDPAPSLCSVGAAVAEVVPSAAAMRVVSASARQPAAPSATTRRRNERDDRRREAMTRSWEPATVHRQRRTRDASSLAPTFV